MSDKHFERREEHNEVNTHNVDHLNPADNRVCSNTVEVCQHSGVRNAGMGVLVAELKPS